MPRSFEITCPRCDLEFNVMNRPGRCPDCYLDFRVTIDWFYKKPEASGNKEEKGDVKRETNRQRNESLFKLPDKPTP